MNKKFFLMLSTAALLAACNQSEKPKEVVHETTVIREVEVPKTEPGVKKVEVDEKGVKINLQDKNGNSFEINKDNK